MDIIVTKFPVTSAQCIPTSSFISFLDVVVVVFVFFFFASGKIGESFINDG